MILFKIVRYELDDEGKPVKALVDGFKPQYFLTESIEEANYRLYTAYLENKYAPCFNLPGFYLELLWSDCGKSVGAKASVRDVIALVIDEVQKGKPDDYQVNGKMY